MNKVEEQAYMLLVCLNLVKQEKDPEVAYPLLLTFSDGTDHVFDKCLFDGRRIENVFEIGNRLLDFSEIQLPVTMAVKDQNGKETTMEITQALVDASIAAIWQAIQ